MKPYWQSCIFLDCLLQVSRVPRTLPYAQERPPATPLVAHDPYFSIWSNTDRLTDSPTRHWTGHPQPLTSLIQVDGKCFRLMGRDPQDVPAMQQISMRLTPTHTVYQFAGSGIAVDLTFFTPAFLDDLDVLSRPVTYLSWTAHATDGAHHAVSILLDVEPAIATSFEGQMVTSSRHHTETTDVLSVGTRDQAILNRSGDNLRIDWDTSILPFLATKSHTPQSLRQRHASSQRVNPCPSPTTLKASCRPGAVRLISASNCPSGQ